MARTLCDAIVRGAVVADPQRPGRKQGVRQRVAPPGGLDPIDVRRGDERPPVAASQGEGHGGERRAVGHLFPIHAPLPSHRRHANVRAHGDERTAEGTGDLLEGAPDAGDRFFAGRTEVEACDEEKLVDRPALFEAVPVTVIESREEGVHAAREERAAPRRRRAGGSLGHGTPQGDDTRVPVPGPPDAEDFVGAVEEGTVDRQLPFEGFAERRRQGQQERQPRVAVARKVTGERGRNLVPVGFGARR